MNQRIRVTSWEPLTSHGRTPVMPWRPDTQTIGTEMWSVQSILLIREISKYLGNFYVCGRQLIIRQFSKNNINSQLLPDSQVGEKK